MAFITSQFNRIHYIQYSSIQYTVIPEDFRFYARALTTNRRINYGNLVYDN